MKKAIMTKREMINLSRKAFESNEVAEFLIGGKDYAVPVSQFIPAYLPTDFDYIIDIGIFGYHEETGDPQIPEQYTAAIYHLLEGDCVSVWCAFSVCYYQISFEQDQESPFTIMSEELISRVSSALYHKKEELESCHLWQGFGVENGLWPDIENMNHLLKKRYGVSFLKEPTQE